MMNETHNKSQNVYISQIVQSVRVSILQGVELWHSPLTKAVAVNTIYVKKLFSL